LIIEYNSGVILSEFINRKKKLTEDEALNIYKQIIFPEANNPFGGINFLNVMKLIGSLGNLGRQCLLTLCNKLENAMCKLERKNSVKTINLNYN